MEFFKKKRILYLLAFDFVIHVIIFDYLYYFREEQLPWQMNFLIQMKASTQAGVLKKWPNMMIMILPFHQVVFPLGACTAPSEDWWDTRCFYSNLFLKTPPLLFSIL